jgi:hypothetical protein
MKAKQKFKTTTEVMQYCHYIHNLIPQITVCPLGTRANLNLLHDISMEPFFPMPLAIYLCVY